MADSTVFAMRYANAFASVAESAGLDIAAAQASMKDFAATLAESRELREVLTDPSIPAEQKLAVVDGLAERLGMMREVRNLVAVVIDHQRLEQWSEIVAAYDNVADAHIGIAEAEITSAFALNEDDRHTLEQQVAKLAGARVRVAYKQDAALLGGAVVRIGSTVYDGSVRGQLQQMKQTLMSA